MPNTTAETQSRLARWHQSTVSELVVGCPRRALASLAGMSGQSDAARIGTQVHAILAEVAATAPDLPDPDDSLASAEALGPEVRYAVESWWGAPMVGHPDKLSAADWLRGADEVLVVEDLLSADVGGVSLGGTPDLVVRAQGRTWVVDWKVVGDTPPISIERDQPRQTQATVLALLVAEHLGEQELPTCVFVSLRRTETRRGRRASWVEYQPAAHDVAALRDQVEQAAAAVRSGWLPNPASVWCGHNCTLWADCYGAPGTLPGPWAGPVASLPEPARRVAEIFNETLVSAAPAPTAGR